MSKLIDWIRRHMLAAAISAASTMVALQLVMPAGVDFILGVINVGLLWVVAKLNYKG